MSNNVVEGIERHGGTECPSGRFAGLTNVEATKGHGGTNLHDGSVVERTQGLGGTKWPSGPFVDLTNVEGTKGHARTSWPSDCVV